jgi:hypothetical protein
VPKGRKSRRTSCLGRERSACEGTAGLEGLICLPDWDRLRVGRGRRVYFYYLFGCPPEM